MGSGFLGFKLVGQYELLHPARTFHIDNNVIENAIRTITLGRKNHLFAGTHVTAQKAAMIYSLFDTCKKYNVNQQEWLTDVL